MITAYFLNSPVRCRQNEAFNDILLSKKKYLVLLIILKRKTKIKEEWRQDVDENRDRLEGRFFFLFRLNSKWLSKSKHNKENFSAEASKWKTTKRLCFVKGGVRVAIKEDVEWVQCKTIYSFMNMTEMKIKLLLTSYTRQFSVNLFWTNIINIMVKL